MTHWTRSWAVAAAAVFALAAVPGAIVTIHAPGIAKADVCVSGGRRVTVSGCANIADAVAPYVPPPAYYAPMPYDPPPPPNVTIEIDRDKDARGLYGVYESVKDQYWKAIDQKKQPSLKWSHEPGV